MQTEQTPQGPLLSGYRKLTDAEVALANEVKLMAAHVSHLVDKLKARGESLDQRWVAEGRTDLQKGFMSLVRSITQPTTF